MDGHTFISWNIPNTVTIWLMLGLGAAAFMIGRSWWAKNQGN